MTRTSKLMLQILLLGFALSNGTNVLAQAVQTVANNAPSIAITPKVAGDTLLVNCGYNSSTTSGVVTDSLGATFVPVGGSNQASSFSQLTAISTSLIGAATDTVRCPTGNNFGDMYVVELKGRVSVDASSLTNGTKTPAAGALASQMTDTVVAFCYTGNCSLPTGWTSLSAFDDNLVASAVGVTSGIFKVSGSSWVLTLVAVNSIAAPPPPPPPANVTLALTGSILFDNATVVYVGPISILQSNGTTWISAGMGQTDVNGTLTGTFAINPNFPDGSGNLVFQFGIPGSAMSIQEAIPLAEFQQSETGVAINWVLFHKAPLVTKSESIALTP